MCKKKRSNPLLTLSKWKKVNINKKLMLFYVCGLIKNQSFFFVVNLLVASKYYKKSMEVFYIKQELPVHEQIRAKEVQVIDENGDKKRRNEY